MRQAIFVHFVCVPCWLAFSPATTAEVESDDLRSRIATLESQVAKLAATRPTINQIVIVIVARDAAAIEAKLHDAASGGSDDD